jgi:ATP-dependent Clp protease ATP-binding subunit ClpA
MLQTNPEIDHIVTEATQLAKDLSHEYVTLEHVFLSMSKIDTSNSPVFLRPVIIISQRVIRIFFKYSNYSILIIGQLN